MLHRAKPAKLRPYLILWGLHEAFMNLRSPDEFAKQTVASVQEYALLAGRAVGNLFAGKRYWADIYTQMDSIGVGSLPIVVLTGFFTGCVLALQAAVSLKEFGAVGMTGRLVALSMVKELGPVLTGLMVSGRNASGMASEIGSMKVSEQIDAMRALGTDPTRKLVTPRVLATVFMLFFLTIISDSCGTAGGALVSVALLRLNGSTFFHTAYMALAAGDIVGGLTKPLFFGFIISTVGCYYGMTTKGGTQGVGRATTQAVVVSSVLIILVDFLVTQLMIGIFGR
jgi:phospholipid/cholesterol/gamma-HCH transport system permease protein